MKKWKYLNGGILGLLLCIVPFPLSTDELTSSWMTVPFSLSPAENNSSPINLDLTPKSSFPIFLTTAVEDMYITAFGLESLENNTTGYMNTAIGYRSLKLNTAGYGNTAVGYQAMVWNETGKFNTAVGGEAGNPIHGDGNTAIGYGALCAGPGQYNTAIGFRAGIFNSEISNYNIYVGSDVVGDQWESNTIRIGTPYSLTDFDHGFPSGQNRTYIAGIYESPLTASMLPQVVGVSAEDGHLGTMSAELLPQGPAGPQGLQGPPGPAGEGLVPGALLFLADGTNPPSGYAFLGNTELLFSPPGSKKSMKITLAVYQKQ